MVIFHEIFGFKRRMEDKGHGQTFLKLRKVTTLPIETFPSPTPDFTESRLTHNHVLYNYDGQSLM